MKYARVKLEGKRAFNLEVTEFTSYKVKGYEVDRLGDRISGHDFDQRLHVIDRKAISWLRPMRINRFYGELETVS